MLPIPQAGVMGWPVHHSLSPRLHGFWLRRYAIAGDYAALPVEPENLAAALRSLSAQGLRGVNLTVPHKEAACAIIDSQDETARRIGAINLVTVEADGTLRGRNTDAYGFTQNLLTCGFTPKGGGAFILGAGGAARAAIVALIDMGFAEIRIANRTRGRGERLARQFATARCAIKTVDWHAAPQALNDVDLLVHATSLGMEGQPALDFPLKTLPAAATVTDIVYTPLETALLADARKRGHRVIDGLGMLLHQARPSFAAFFGRDPEVNDELRRFMLAGGTL